MRDTKEHTINGCTYKIQQLPGKLSRKVATRILKCVGPAIESENPIEKFVTLLNDADLDFVSDAFAKVTRFSPEAEPDKEWLLADKFDEHFAGKFGTMCRWLWANVETNYGDFLGELGISPEVLATIAANATKALSTTGQTPSSGASSVRATESSAK